MDGGFNRSAQDRSARFTNPTHTYFSNAVKTSIMIQSRADPSSIEAPHLFRRSTLEVQRGFEHPTRRIIGSWVD